MSTDEDDDPEGLGFSPNRDEDDHDPDEMKLMDDAWYVLVFHNDGARATLVHTWDGMLMRLKEGVFGNLADEPLELQEHKNQWAGIEDSVLDFDDWGMDADGPFFYRLDLGEDAISIIRLSLEHGQEFPAGYPTYIAGDQVTDDMVEQVEQDVGMGAGAWDLVNARDLMAAIVNAWLKYRTP